MPQKGSLKSLLDQTSFALMHRRTQTRWCVRGSTALHPDDQKQRAFAALVAVLIHRDRWRDGRRPRRSVIAIAVDGRNSSPRPRLSAISTLSCGGAGVSLHPAPSEFMAVVRVGMMLRLASCPLQSASLSACCVQIVGSRGGS